MSPISKRFDRSQATKVCEFRGCGAPFDFK